MSAVKTIADVLADAVAYVAMVTGKSETKVYVAECRKATAQQPLEVVLMVPGRPTQWRFTFVRHDDAAKGWYSHAERTVPLLDQGVSLYIGGRTH